MLLAAHEVDLFTHLSRSQHRIRTIQRLEPPGLRNLAQTTSLRQVTGRECCKLIEHCHNIRIERRNMLI